VTTTTNQGGSLITKPCAECDLAHAHCHCECGFQLPLSIVALGERVPSMGDRLKVIPGNFVVKCPSCGDGSLVRVKARSN